MQTPTALRSDPLLVVIGELPWFLTDEALRAARAMKFVPATKDGRPVSQYVTLEYNFNIY